MRSFKAVDCTVFKLFLQIQGGLMSRASGLMLMAVCLLVAQVRAAEPEAKEPIIEASLSELFEMTFEGPAAGAASATFLKDFQLRSPGGFDLSNGKLTLKPTEDQPFSLMRPILAGPIARWRVALTNPDQNPKQIATTKLAFVLGSRQLAILEIQRRGVRATPPESKQASGEAEGNWIEFFLQGGDGKRQSLRSEKLPVDKFDGVWEFSFHHGYLRASRDGKLCGQSFAEVNPNTAPVIGVLLEQKGADLTLSSLALVGKAQAAVPPALEVVDALREAQRANLRAAQAYVAGNLDEAARAAEEAVILWQKAKGNPSADGANAAFNLATIMKAKQDPIATRAAYQMVFDSRRAVLGAAHPLTALALLDLARAHAQQNDAASARALAAEAAQVLAESHGETHSLTTEAKQLAAP